MKIAVVGPVYPWRGGIAHYTDLLARHLAGEHAVRVYSFKQQYPRWLFPGRTQLDPGPAPEGAVEALSWLVPWRPGTWARVARDWTAWGAQVIVVQWWVPFMAPMTGWLLRRARGRGVPAVAICHNVLPHERGPLDGGLARLALAAATGLVVHAEGEAQAAQALLPGQPVRVARMPRYDVPGALRRTREQARAELNVQGRVLLFFGFVRPYKGLLDLLAAMPTLVERCQASLLVVGEIWGEAEPYFELVRRLGLERRVRFVDRYVTNDEAAAYFSAADLVVLPYRHATGSAATQLALAFGVPVVATRAGSLPEAIEDKVTGYLVEPGDVAGLAAAIERFFSEERAEDFRRAIEQQHARFAWDNIGRAVLALAAAKAA